MATIASKLKKLKTKYYELIRVRDHLVSLDKKLTTDIKLLEKSQRKMEKEFKQFDALEGKSLKGFFYSILGSKEKQLEKERQEYIQASLKYEEQRKTVDLTEYEADILDKKIAKLELIEAEYNRLITVREKELLRSNSVAGRRLIKLIKNIEENEQFLHSLKKVDGIGKKANKSLDSMIRYLKEANNWGNWDMVGGRRGGHSDYAKHSAIDRAKRQSYQTMHVLGQLENALSSVYGRSKQFNFNIQIDGFSRFTDIFFDNLISDWVIQQKISNSLNNVKSIRDKVSRILQSLQADYQNTQNQNAELAKERKKIIENS